MTTWFFSFGYVWLLFLIFLWNYGSHNENGSLSDTGGTFFYCRYLIPLARGALALSIVIGYISKNKFLGLLVTYSSILILVTYFAALIFYQKENSVNSGVTDYWDAFWWGCSQATTLGCDIYPVTAVGRILCCILSAMGIVMFPLFTVYATDAIQRYYSRKVDITVNSHIVKP